MELYLAKYTLENAKLKWSKISTLQNCQIKMQLKYSVLQYSSDCQELSPACFLDDWATGLKKITCIQTCQLSANML